MCHLCNFSSIHATLLQFKRASRSGVSRNTKVKNKQIKLGKLVFTAHVRFACLNLLVATEVMFGAQGQRDSKR